MGMPTRESSRPTDAPPGAASGPGLRGATVGVAAISLGGGGAERQAVLWAHAATEEGADVRVLALEDGERGYGLPQQATVSIVGKNSRADTVRAIRHVRRLGRTCDVVAAFQPYTGLLCMAAGLRNYVVVSGQDPRHWRDTSRVPGALLRAGLARSAAATAPSRGLIDCHRDLGLRPRGDAWLHVPNVVADEAFAAVAPAREGVLFVGRLVPEKEPLRALRAAAMAGLPITFLGDGPLREDLRREARRIGVGTLLRLEPFTPEPWAHFARHRVLVVTSRYETFANVIVESLAAGTPVVSVDCDFGPREILAGATASRLVAASDEAVAAALADVAGRPVSDAGLAECREIAGRYRRTTLTPAIAAALRTGMRK